MPLISVVINCDTRPERGNEEGLSKGVVSRDFLTDGVFNKVKFVDGLDAEIILFIDKHEEIPQQTLEYIQKICDVVVIRKHTGGENFNDYNYMDALKLARGKYVMHFDQDTAAFTSSTTHIEDMIKLLSQYKFVSYPSFWSPNAVEDSTFGGKMWASTRFFICERETLDFKVLEKCIKNPDWAYEYFGDSPRKCNWLEHFLTLANHNSVYYPQLQMDKYTIFSWENYNQYTLRRLNELPYEEIYEWHKTHPLFYPNNCNA